VATREGWVTTVGVRDLKNRLSEFLRRVAAGERITVTDRGRPVALMTPPDAPAEHEAIVGMVREGIASWGGGKPRGSARPVRVRGKPVSQTVLEDRR
jgi:prevent-host-death family protein